ncbi:MAG: type II toxin-antitoxin system prevent-host-death family antitoxin [Deltaproteobacteria bacterium]|nr:type II toxin-antitoxin system prevent-host-death family antitoxin [Deltaproteobacteria bacterium]
MSKVKVGELRNHLSKYLKKVRRGAEVVITDRETPIGKLVPYSAIEEEPFEVMPPEDGYEGLAKLEFPPILCPVDIVELLLADRRRR